MLVAKMTLGQVSEIGFMLLMPFFFSRLGVKKMILVGIIGLDYYDIYYSPMVIIKRMVWMFYSGNFATWNML